MSTRQRNRADPQGLCGLFAAPGTIWLIVLFVVPFYGIAAIAFGRLDPIFGSALPRWNPLQWNFGATPQKGAVLVLILSALLLVLMWYYLVITTRAQRAAR